MLLLSQIVMVVKLQDIPMMHGAFAPLFMIAQVVKLQQSTHSAIDPIILTKKPNSITYRVDTMMRMLVGLLMRMRLRPFALIQMCSCQTFLRIVRMMLLI